ncbi:unnamed protein product [Closterium sp. NIES-53]
MTSLRRNGGSGDGGGGGSGGGGGRPSSRCGAVRWGFWRWPDAAAAASARLGVPGGGLTHLQQRLRETLTPQQLREWYVQRGASRSSTRCPYVIRTEFGDATELPRWLELVRQGVDIFALDYDAILTTMYALSASAEGDCSRCVPPDPGIAAAALGASASGTPPGTAPAEALHTFTLDYGASRCFFRDSTTLTPLPAPVPIRLADPSGGPVVARSSTVLPCPAIPSGSLSGLHLRSFSTNLVSTAAPQDAMVTTTTPRGQRVPICMCTRTGRHLPTFTRRPRLSLYTLATKPPQVAASAQVSASGQVAASCSCRLLSHQTLLWHYRQGHPSQPCLHGMHSRFLVSGLSRSLHPLPPSPAPPCLPCIEGRQRAAPHSSSFPLTTAPLQTLHMDVWGPACVSGQGRERYFLLVVEDYMRYTTVFPLRSKGEVVDVLIPWIRTVRLQLRERFGTDLLFTLPDSPQQNGIAERLIGLIMEIARTSMIHAAAPHFLWPFAVRYAAHPLNLWPRVSLSETSPALRWSGKVGDASVFRFYHPTSRRVLPSQDVMIDESVPFYHLFPYRSAPHPPLPLFLAPGPPPVDPLPPQGPAPSGVSQVDPLLGVGPVQVAVGSGAAPGAASGGAASGGAEPGGAGSEGAGSGGADPGGAEPEGVEPGGAESEGAESGGATPRGAASSGGPAGASQRMSSQQLREWLVRRAHCRSGAPGAAGAGDTGAGGDAVTTGAGGTGGTAATGPGGARTSGAGAGGAGVGGPGAGGAGAAGAGVGGTGAGGAGAAGAGAVDPGAGGAGGTVRPRPYFVPLLQQALGVPSSTGLPPPFLCLPPDQTQPPLQTASPLPTPSPYTEQSGGLTERPEPASRPVSPVRTARRAPCSRPPSIPGSYAMALRPSSVPLRVPLPAPSESSLHEVPDPESDRAHASSPIVSRLLATVVTDPSFESSVASALVAELLDFAAACRLDYASSLVAESESASPPYVGGECALGTDVLKDKQEDFECLAAALPHFASMLLAPEGDPDAPDIPTPRSYAEAITGPYSSQWQAAMDAEMASWKSTGTYIDAVPPSRANIVNGMWIFRGVDYFQAFSPTPKMTTLRVLLHIAAQRDYELHSLDLSTAFLQGSLHEEIWLRRPPCFTGTFPAGTQWSLRRPVYGLRQAPHEWHDKLRTTLAALGFGPSVADPSLFPRTDTSLPPFYVLMYVVDLVFATADTEALTLVKSELQKRHTCTDLGPSALRLPVLLATAHSSVYQPLALSSTFGRVRRAESSVPRACGLLAYPLSLLARYVAPGRHRKVHWDAAKRALRYLCSTSGMGLVLGGRGPVVLTGHADASWVYAGAMASQELRWLTYLLTDLGEQPCSPPERGQLRLAYVATRANTADVFTKALPPGDHQRFATVLGLVPTFPHLLTA